jgi:hypothetical protein
MSVSVLEREMFSEAEAARLLRVPQSTFNYRAPSTTGLKAAFAGTRPTNQ